MQTNKRILGLVAVAALFLGGCATGATAEGMTVRAADIKAPASPAVTKAVAVGVVAGGTKTQPLWLSQIENPAFKEALTKSLHVAGLLSNEPHPKYTVTVQLIALQQPVFGFDMTVTSRIRYTLVESKTGAVVFTEEVVAPYTATMGDSVIGPRRLRLANEGSARASIAALINKLNAANGSTKGAPAPLVLSGATHSM